jgi:hypothetical protein
VSAEAQGVCRNWVDDRTCLAASPSDETGVIRMLFATRAIGAPANILFDRGASHNSVSFKVAKLTGIIVSPPLQKIRPGDDEEGTLESEATVYIRRGTFKQPVKCLLMNLVIEVDVISLQ